MLSSYSRLIVSNSNINLNLKQKKASSNAIVSTTINQWMNNLVEIEGGGAGGDTRNHQRCNIINNNT